MTDPRACIHRVIGQNDTLRADHVYWCDAPDPSRADRPVSVRPRRYFVTLAECAGCPAHERPKGEEK
jgi:hypothetical protein